MFYISLDISSLLNIGTSIDEASKAAMKSAGARLTAMTRAHIVEEANRRLHTRRDMFIDGLEHFQLNDDTWVVSLSAKVRWIDDGLSPHSLLDDLLKSPKAKRAKNGSLYAIIPFQHKKGPTQMTPAQKTLLDTIKKELTDRKIPYGKTETDAQGKPKIGLLHKFDIKNSPIKTTNSPGQGKGPIGSVMQGPTGIPLLQGVRVYQRQVKNKDGSSSVKRDIMTFRVASSRQKGQGKWDHPGTEAVKIMDEAYEWAKKEWENTIVPQISLELSKSF